MKVIDYLNMGIYPGTVLLSSGFTYDELIENLKETGADEWALGISEDKDYIDGGNYFAMKRTVTKDNKSVAYYYLFMREPFTRTDYEYAKLAHEVLHICQFHLPDILDRNCEFESEAYLHTHLMMQVLNHLK